MQFPEKYWAGGFLYNPASNSIFLHKRDSKTKFNPNKWAFFGGLNEGSENPVQCFIRELEEEIGLKVRTDDVIYLRDYLNIELNTYRIVFYVENQMPVEKFILGEGAGFNWIKLDDIGKYDLTEKTLDDVLYFMREKQND